MKNAVILFAASLCLFFSSCHRPVAYFQRTPRAAARLPVEPPTRDSVALTPDWLGKEEVLAVHDTNVNDEAIARADVSPIELTNTRVTRRLHRMQTVLATSTETTTQQPRPKPKPKNQLRLGNRIRQGLGIPLREELNWWQRISWKLKASVIIILVAVLFAILHITLLAIIFGIVGAFLLISGLRKSFKVRRPWF
ncbi:hypothetical protein [Spirosoma knui]